MRDLILLASLVVCCYAAPTPQQHSNNEHITHSVLLNRPSPINPDIPSDPKPEEKITMITDPKEIVKYKREAVDDPYEHISRFAPTVPPAKQAEKVQAQQSHEKDIPETDLANNRQKREETFHILEAKKPAVAPSAVPTPSSLDMKVKGDSDKQTDRHNESATPTRDVSKTRQRRQVDPHLIGASTVGFAPQIHIDDEEKKTPEEEVITETSPQEQNVSETQQAEDDAQVVGTNEPEVAQAKRDIPVPLVPKYHHPDESPKSAEKVKENEHYQGSAGHKDNESSDSDESDENSKEKKSAAQVHTHPFVQSSVHAQGANGYHQQISTQPLLPQGSNAEVTVHDKPLAESGHHQINGQNSQGLVHSNPIMPSEVAHETSVTKSDNKPLEDHLADAKLTKIIAYEPSANNDHLAIKHPVPVAELFSRPKE